MASFGIRTSVQFKNVQNLVFALVTIQLFGVCNASAQEQQPEADKNFSPTGYWVGDVELDGKEFLAVLQIKNVEGAWQIEGTSLPLKLKNAEASMTVVGDSKIEFSFKVQDGAINFNGHSDSNSDLVKGTVSYEYTDKESVQGTFEFRKSIDPRTAPDSKTYAGKIAGPNGSTLEVAIAISSENNVASVDLPILELRNYPLSKVSIDDNSFSANLIGNRPASLEAEFDGDELHGFFVQNGLKLTMDLKLDRDYAYSELSRPQHPTRPYPYKETEILVDHPEGHVLSGTLTLPDSNKFGNGPYTCAILISGGGQEDRDCSALGHKPFLVIADYLTRRGIAVLRFDDRGVGKSKVLDKTPVGSNATTAEIATDTLAVYRHLQNLEEIDPDRIGLIGHSEGGAIAPLVCAEEPSVAFAVLMAGPGVKGDSLFRRQLELMWQLGGASDQEVQRCSLLYSEFQRAICEASSREQIVSKAEQLVDELMNSEMEPKGVSRKELLESYLQFDSRWWRFMFAYDPVETLKKVECPILAINGTKDCQVDHELNLNGIKKAMASKNELLEIRRYKGMNHLFQRCETGAPSEYASIPTTIEESVLDDICKWIKSTDSKSQTKSDNN